LGDVQRLSTGQNLICAQIPTLGEFIVGYPLSANIDIDGEAMQAY